MVHGWHLKVVFPKLSFKTILSELFETTLSESSSEVLQRYWTTTATNGPLNVTSRWIVTTVCKNMQKYLQSVEVDAEEASFKIVLNFSNRFFLTFTLCCL